MPTEFSQTKLVPVSEIAQSSMECAWKGCIESFALGSEMPTGWVSLITFWSPMANPDLTIDEVVSSPFCKRDAVLCPKHAAELEALLKDIGNRLRETAGNA